MDVPSPYDDGTTWKKVRLIRDHDHWTAEVNHPKDTRFASLRFSVTDPDGAPRTSSVGTTGASGMFSGARQRSSPEAR